MVETANRFGPRIAVGAVKVNVMSPPKAGTGTEQHAPTSNAEAMPES
jgi:hypothetical protein